MFVVRLTGRVTSYEDIIAGTAARVTEKWYHVGLLYQSPWMPTFWEVVPVEDLGEAPPERRRRYVAGTNDFLMLHHAMLPFAKAGAIGIQLYRMEDTGRRLAQFSAGPVPIIEEPGHADPHPFWPRQRNVREAAAGGDPDAPAEPDAPPAPEDHSDSEPEPEEPAGEGPELDILFRI